MLNVTDKAAATLHATLDANDPEADQVLRLRQSAEGLGLVMDEEREGDQVVAHEERSVLVIEPAVAQALDGAVIDAVDTPEGQRLVLQAPEEA